MASSTAKTAGITGPLSTALPTEVEIKMTESLKEELSRQNNYESQSETNKRHVVLDSLESIAKEFVKQVCREQNQPESVINSAGAKVVTFGSFRLGVYGPGSDIDTLVVGPKNVQREAFFRLFPDLLVKRAPEGAITGLTAVPDAYVPVIKFEYSGISIDLLYSRIAALSSIPGDLTLLDNNLLRGLEDDDIRVLNGNRVTDEILELVPQKAVFKAALRAIKLWAQRRAIYANIVGFLGGVAWAMLVARVCQLYPKATGSTIVLKFFQVMTRWQWPQPVQLKQPENFDLGKRVWNPKVYKGDSYHLMPIITPAYPSMCATHNVTHSTREIMHRELKRGGMITDRIMTGKGSWKDLFAKHTFFSKDYKYYLSVISASTTKEAQKIWCGRVESKVRQLVSKLDVHDSIAVAHPFNKTFERVHRCRTEEEIEKAKSGSLEYQFKDIPTETTDLKNEPEGGVAIAKEEDAKEDQKPNGDENFTFVYTTTSYIGLELHEGQPWDPSAAHLLIQIGAKSLDLAWEVNDFKNHTTDWDMYDKELNALSVVHTRNYDLPDDVFAEGEVKPTRPAKKSKKRAATEAQSDTSAAPTKRQQTSVAAVG